MDKFVMLPEQERAALFMETAGAMKMTPGVVEKDFWVVWVLDHLFSSELLADKILFKGGTSLSKVFGLIERFSEDIDLILDWNEVVSEDPNLERSKNKQDKFNKAVPKQSRLYIEKIFLPEVQRLLGEVCTAEIEAGAPDVINIKYPSS
ncbi:MAG: nucleotidyl transferase AbiEii/AbiGii toxin family protein, partial [Verrucomicrobia bacterium]